MLKLVRAAWVAAIAKGGLAGAKASVPAAGAAAAAGGAGAALWTFPSILLSAFAIGWGAEAAQFFMSQGLALAILAWLQTLPEFAVEADIAWRGDVSNMTANFTGSLRLLVGLGWPMVFGVGVPRRAPAHGEVAARGRSRGRGLGGRRRPDRSDRLLRLHLVEGDAHALGQPGADSDVRGLPLDPEPHAGGGRRVDRGAGPRAAHRDAAEAGSAGEQRSSACSWAVACCSTWRRTRS
jgi:hypothetical protein